MCCLSKPVTDPSDVPPPAVPNTVKPVRATKPRKKNYSSKEDRLRHLTNYYEVKLLTNVKLSIRDYSADHQLPRSTFQDHLGALKVADKLTEKMPVPQFREIVRKYLDVVETNMKVRTETASVSNRYLTNNEERQFILFSTIMCEVGYGISKPELKTLIDEYVNADAILQEMEESSSKIIDNVLKRNPGLAKFLKAGALDPKRARQATEKTRRNFFQKMDCFIKLLYEQGAVPWKNFSEIPANKIYNMDEVGFDFTGHRLKVLTSTEVRQRRLANQQCTPDGDGKMMRHITGCVTTCASGTYIRLVVAYAYWVIVSDLTLWSCVLQACIAIEKRKSGRARRVFSPSIPTRESLKTKRKTKEKGREGDRHQPKKPWQPGSPMDSKTPILSSLQVALVPKSKSHSLTTVSTLSNAFLTTTTLRSL
jgi:hypothetical protein